MWLLVLASVRNGCSVLLLLLQYCRRMACAAADDDVTVSQAGSRNGMPGLARLGSGDGHHLVMVFEGFWDPEHSTSS